jgi:DNA primase small subunit
MPKSAISKVKQREFGFIKFEGWMQRHKSFQGMEELKEFLQVFIPSDAYYSCAYYENPKAEMDSKGWLGADLIFDIDADHIPTPCNKIHDKWRCDNCGFSGKGIPPEKCPVCSREKFVVSTWPCEICLDSSKDETLKLLDMLTQDFGFSQKEIRIFFSGHRGYHIIVESKVIETLDAMSRKEIVDYITGLGVDLFHELNAKSKSKTSTFPEVFISDIGLLKRLVQGLQSFMATAKDDDFKNIGLKSNVVEVLMRNRNLFLENLQKKGEWIFVKGVGFSSWRKIMMHVIKLQSAKIDTVVTTDIHRLIRLPDTLHGKTGFKKVEFPISDIYTFDPFKDAIAFNGGEVFVNISDAPEFRVGDKIFGPYKNQQVELPTAAALFLICKGRAEVVKE